MVQHLVHCFRSGLWFVFVRQQAGDDTLSKRKGIKVQGNRVAHIADMLSLHHPSLAHGLTRPGRDASPQQIAEYHHRTLVADGAIPPSSFSPFEPGDAAALMFEHNDRIDGAGCFYGRHAPRSVQSTAAANLFEPEDLSPSHLGLERLQGPLPRALSQASEVVSMMFGPRRSDACPSEDDLIAAQLEEVRQVERDFMAALRTFPKDDEDLIREEALLMVAAQRASSTSQHSQAEDSVTESAAAGDLTPAAATSATSADDAIELETVLAASRATSEEECDASLQRALELSVLAECVESTAEASTDVSIPEEMQQGAEAGVDIPVETPKSLLDGPAAAVAAPDSSVTFNKGTAAVAASKATRAKGRRGKGKGAQD